MFYGRLIPYLQIGVKPIQIPGWKSPKQPYTTLVAYNKALRRVQSVFELKLACAWRRCKRYRQASERNNHFKWSESQSGYLSPLPSRTPVAKGGDGRSDPLWQQRQGNTSHLHATAPPPVAVTALHSHRIVPESGREATFCRRFTHAGRGRWRSPSPGRTASSLPCSGRRCAGGPGHQCRGRPVRCSRRRRRRPSRA